MQNSVAIVRPESVQNVWLDVRPLLQPAVDMNDGFNMEDVLSGLVSGSMMLWIYYDDKERICAAMVTDLLQYPRKKAVFVLFVGGTKFDEWKQFFGQLKAYAARAGASSIEGIGRAGFARALGADTVESFYRFNVQGE